MAIIAPKRRKKVLTGAFCLIFTLVAFFHTRAVLAQTSVIAPATQQLIVVEPTFQDITLEEASASAQAIVTLKNQTDTAQRFSVFAVDINQIDAEGNVTLSDKPISGDSYALADFLDLSPSTVVLQPLQSQLITVTIKNLQDLSPGGHYAAVVIKGEIQGQIKSGTTQTILPAVSSFLLVHKKGGERYHLSLKSVDLSQQFLYSAFPKQLTLLFENQGNVHVAPRGEIQMTDVFHRKVVEGTINEGSKLVLPEAQREIDVQLRQIRPAFPFMLYVVDVAGRSEPGNIAVSQSLMIAVVSPMTALLTVISILLFLVMLVKRRMILRLVLRLRKKYYVS